jgi:hypothetical protein
MNDNKEACFPPKPPGYLTTTDIKEIYGVSTYVLKKIISKIGDDGVMHQLSLNGALTRHLYSPSIIDEIKAVIELKPAEELEGYLDTRELSKLTGQGSARLHQAFTYYGLYDEIYQYGSGGKKCSKLLYSPELVEKYMNLLNEKRNSPFKTTPLAEYIDKCYHTADFLDYLEQFITTITTLDDEIHILNKESDSIMGLIENFMKRLGFVPTYVAREVLGVSRQRISQIINARNMLKDESIAINLRENAAKSLIFISEDYIHNHLTIPLPGGRKAKEEDQNQEPIKPKEPKFNPDTWVALTSASTKVGVNNNVFLTAVSILGLDEHVTTKIPNGKCKLVKLEIIPIVRNYLTTGQRVEKIE